MPKFVVYVHESATYRYRVEADTEEEAQTKALELYGEDGDKPWNYQYESADVQLDESDSA